MGKKSLKKKDAPSKSRLITLIAIHNGSVNAMAKDEGVDWKTMNTWIEQAGLMDLSKATYKKYMDKKIKGKEIVQESEEVLSGTVTEVNEKPAEEVKQITDTDCEVVDNGCAGSYVVMKSSEGSAEHNFSSLGKALDHIKATCTLAEINEVRLFMVVPINVNVTVGVGNTEHVA